MKITVPNNFNQNFSSALARLSDFLQPDNLRAAISRLWRATPEPLPPGPASTPNVNAIALNLCNGDADLATWMLRWLAYPLRVPGTKMDNALWFCGGPGAGKSMFFQRVAAPMHAWRSVTVDTQFHSHFNAWASKKAFAVVEDFDGRAGSLRRAKLLMTSSSILIERKLAEPVLERNQINYVFCSGHIDALPADVGNRRFAVFNVGTPLHPDVYGEAATEILNGAAHDWHHFLLNELDMGDFTPSTPAPISQAFPEQAI